MLKNTNETARSIKLIFYSNAAFQKYRYLVSHYHFIRHKFIFKKRKDIVIKHKPTGAC